MFTFTLSCTTTIITTTTTNTFVCVVVDYICRALPDVYIDKLFSFVASQLADSAEKGFYVTWNQLLLESHGTRLKQRSLAVMPAVNDLQKSLRTVHDVNKMYVFYQNKLFELLILHTCSDGK